MTREARLGLNGPEVIEQESGIDEFDSSDSALIWAIHGGAQRVGMGLADALVEDDANKIASTVRGYVLAGLPASAPQPAGGSLSGSHRCPGYVEADRSNNLTTGVEQKNRRWAMSEHIGLRGRAWFEALDGKQSAGGRGS